MCLYIAWWFSGDYPDFLRPFDIPIFLFWARSSAGHMTHSHAVHLPLGALLSPCTACGTGGYTYYHIWQALVCVGTTANWCAA